MFDFGGLALWLHLVLTFTGVGLIFFVTKLYKPYKRIQAYRFIMKPFLFLGVTFSLAGATEIIEPYFEWGKAFHAVVMLLSAIFLAYGAYNYHEVLNRLDVIEYAKEVLKLTKDLKNGSS